MALYRLASCDTSDVFKTQLNMMWEDEERGEFLSLHCNRIRNKHVKCRSSCLLLGLAITDVPLDLI